MIRSISEPSGGTFNTVTRGWPDGSTSSLRIEALPQLLHPDGTLWFLNDGVDGDASDDRYVAVDLFLTPPA